MRKDMFKVIVERPRRVNSNAYSRDGRRFRNQEEAPSFLGMKRGYGDRKWLNENLRPLERYLESQINRPWNKVFSEICANIDNRNTVQQHILQHLDTFVEINAKYEQTAKGLKIFVRERSWMSHWVPLKGSRTKMYVHPITGILLRNKHYVSWSQYHRDKRAPENRVDPNLRRDIDRTTQLHQLNGVWYRVTLQELPAPYAVLVKVDGVLKKRIDHPQCWDAVCKRHVSQDKDGAQLKKLYGGERLYAASKQQLDSKAIKKLGLAGKTKAPKSGPLFLVLPNRNANSFASMVASYLERALQ